jgi:RNA polymerase sigma-70 factor (ECF subfamily)
MAQKGEANLLTTLSDSLLLQRAADGDTASFATLFYRHYDRVYGLLFRLVGNRDEAEDLTQEVFVKLHQQRFAAGAAHNVGAWLYRVATNTGYNAMRARRRRWQRNTLLVPDASDEPVDPAAQVAQRETQEAVRAALAQLPVRDVQLLLLRQMGASYAELADVCDVAPGSVGTLLRRAAVAFRRAYEEREDDPT